MEMGFVWENGLGLFPKWIKVSKTLILTDKKTLRVLWLHNNKTKIRYFEALELEFGIKKFANLPRSAPRNLRLP